MDGVDVAYCRFIREEGRWTYEIIRAATYGYDKEWLERLNGLFRASASDYASAHAAYGKYLGEMARRFMNEYAIREVDFISSHGHTVFHQPAAGFTAQIGEGAALAAASGQTVICDFRTSDVAYGGQGAPLVPLGDRHLFPEHPVCLNLGGIANISFEQEGRRIAFDVCPCNMLLNHYAHRAGKPYDENGALAAAGSCHDGLLEELNAMDFYSKLPPKSLGREEVEKFFIPVMEQYELSPSDILRTLAEHIAVQVAASLSSLGHDNASMLVSGGGTFNTFLIEQLRKNSGIRLEIPDAITINYKEALIFAFLGVLRFRGEPNCLQSVTGAAKDVIGGAIYLS